MSDTPTEPGTDLVPVIAQHAPMLAVGSFSEAGKVAATLCNTTMVPKGMRGDKAAVFAVIVWASEVGVGIIQALNGVQVVEGHTAPTPQMMRALIMRAGHTFAVREMTPTTCTVYGKRHDTGEELAVTWTIEDANRAGLVRPNTPWTKYPADMLLARATSRLGRIMFSDVIAGLGYTPDEVAYDQLGGVPMDDETSAAHRDHSDVTPPAPVTNPLEDPDTALADDDGIIDAEVIEVPRMSQVTNRRLFALLGAAQVADDDDRHQYASTVLGRTIESFTELTEQDGLTLCDSLQELVNDKGTTAGSERAELAERIKTAATKAAFMAWVKDTKSSSKVADLTDDQVSAALAWLGTK